MQVITTVRTIRTEKFAWLAATPLIFGGKTYIYVHADYKNSLANGQIAIGNNTVQ